jgi:hypothetical protein
MATDTFRKVIACAIVKNEEIDSITRPLRELRAIMGDALVSIVIHDTGSDEFHEIDPGIVQGVTGVATRLKRRPFDDFSNARNACLADASRLSGGRAAWLLMFSAGAEFTGVWDPGPGRCNLHTETCGALTFSKVGPIRAGSSLHYQGLTHESIDPGQPIDTIRHCGLRVSYDRDWNLEKKRQRWELDVQLLANDFSPRGRFYLAQSLDMLGRAPDAFYYYVQRSNMLTHEPERLQAVAGAVKNAPTLRLACTMHLQGDWCADVTLALAERYLEFKERKAAAYTAMIALGQSTRSMFARGDLDERCAEIVKKNT